MVLRFGETTAQLVSNELRNFANGNRLTLHINQHLSRVVSTQAKNLQRT